MVARLAFGLLAGFLVVTGEANAECGASARPLSDIQGDGDSSPLAGQTVTIEGIMTLDARHPAGWRGFYLQQSTDESDGNPKTSDALFVYTDRAGGQVGSRVRVTGVVKEYHGLTELVSVSRLTVCGTGPVPEPVPVTLPWPNLKPPEHLENMRVTLTGPLILSGHYSFARYGELIIADRFQITPTEHLPPGPEAQSLARQQALGRVYLDDGRSSRNPTPLPWPASRLTEGEPVRAGDRIEKISGILDYRFDHWRLQPTSQPRLAEAEPRPPAPVRAPAANLRVVTLNLGNFFNGNGGQFENSRGASSQEQFVAQKKRLIATLKALEPDIIAAVEVENDSYLGNSAVADLARAMGAEWRFIATPGATGSDAIRTDLLFRADRVQTVSEPRRLSRIDGRYPGRPPVAQAFQAKVNNGASKTVRIVVPHFKSKSCAGASGADKDQGDGQGCYTRRRTEEAAALANWLDALPEPANFAGTLVTGDLNSYAREWPIQKLEDAGLTNLVRARRACSSDQCPHTSYLYQGRRGSLDYALGSESLEKHVVDAGVWAVNAEEFPAIGYQGPLAMPLNAPWRSSDHNPVYTDLAL